MKEIPSSVYRIQVSDQFPIKKVISLLPYLNNLGVEGIYLSPIFDSFSPHGYDVGDPNHINTQIGTVEEFDELCSQLKQFKMKQILDVVPNHMGIKGTKNIWWLDVLKNGPNSDYAKFFDINWNTEKEGLKNKILLPVLKDPYGKVLENGEIKLIASNGFWITYADYKLPIAKSSDQFIAEKGFESFQGEKGNPKSFDLLHELLERQWYRLAHWLVAGQEINYRRFFNINELIGIHIERENVFEAHHKWVLQLHETGKVQGFRIDHPDGLYDPTEYFKRLKEKKVFFVLVEKVLDFNESLPKSWQVEGTVGYSYLNLLSGLFVERKNEKAFTTIYNKFIGFTPDYDQWLYQRKKWYTNFHMGSEINLLGYQLDQISEKNRYTRDFTRRDLTKAIQEVTACFPVYRTYINPHEEMHQKDVEYVNKAVDKAKRMAPEVDALVFDYLRDILLLKWNSDPLIYDFVMRFQQMTAPAMAKGLEDSLYYIYNRLISLNEVGNNPKYFGVSIEEFHEFNQKNQKNYPFSLLATSTHDTKRSEDVRMRLNVLSEMPKKWGSLLKSWKKENEKFGPIDPNTEYYIYQTLLGIWSEEEPSFDRIWNLILKSLREAGVNTNWRIIDEEYENKVKTFVKSLLKNPNFMSQFHEFQKEIDHFGRWNSLSELVLKLGSPGIVDIYQGNETFTYRLMDPDNREVIDYSKMPQDDLKFFITKTGLQFRKAHKELFLLGEYIPLKVTGKHVIAFARVFENQVAIIAAARFFTTFEVDETYIEIPAKIKATILKDIFTQKEISIQKVGKKYLLKLSEIFTPYTFTILSGSIEERGD